jgi:hypothetical protein
MMSLNTDHDPPNHRFTPWPSLHGPPSIYEHNTSFWRGTSVFNPGHNTTVDLQVKLVILSLIAAHFMIFCMRK